MRALSTSEDPEGAFWAGSMMRVASPDLLLLTREIVDSLGEMEGMMQLWVPERMGQLRQGVGLLKKAS